MDDEKATAIEQELFELSEKDIYKFTQEFPADAGQGIPNHYHICVKTAEGLASSLAVTISTLSMAFLPVRWSRKALRNYSSNSPTCSLQTSGILKHFRLQTSYIRHP